MSVVIRTECAQSGQPMTFEFDSEFQYRIVEGGAKPMVFHPFVDFSKLKASSIINDF
jgi:hypothetical protein